MNIEENWSDWKTHRDDGNNKVATVAVGMKTRSQRKFHVFRCEVGSLHKHDFFVNGEARSFSEKFPRESAEEANFLSEFQDPLTSSVN